jgi:hypothetical protein
VPSTLLEATNATTNPAMFITRLLELPVELVKVVCIQYELKLVDSSLSVSP